MWPFEFVAAHCERVKNYRLVYEIPALEGYTIRAHAHNSIYSNIGGK